MGSRLGAIVAPALLLPACGTSSLQRAIAPIPGDEFVARTTDLLGEELPDVPLVWADTYFIDDGPFGTDQESRPAVFMTCHASMFGWIVRLFRRHGDRVELDAECQFTCGALEEPECFARHGHRFLLFTHNWPGSASNWTHHVYWIEDASEPTRDSFRVREVPIERPVDSLRSLIGPGQHSEPCRTSITLERGQLQFAFSIWNPGEHDDFPTGGWVEGALEPEFDDQGTPTRFRVESWTFHAGMDVEDEVQDP